MRILLAWLLTLSFAGLLHLGLRASFSVPAAADPEADDPTIAQALAERAKLLDSPTPLDLVLDGPLVETNAGVARKIRNPEPTSFEGSAASRRWFRRQNLIEADRQLAFVGTSLGGIAFRWWLAALLAPIALACFAFQGSGWTPAARRPVRSLGLLCAVFVLGPGIVNLQPVSIGVAVLTLVLAALGFAIAGRLTSARAPSHDLTGHPSPAIPPSS